MSLSANIDHLAIANGIEAVVVDADSRHLRGDEKWHPILCQALDLFVKTGEPSIRLVVGRHTIVVQRENGQTVAVVLPTGHAIAKSLRRMIRRMAKKDRGPVRSAAPAQPAAPQVAPPPQAPPAAPQVDNPNPANPSPGQGPQSPTPGGNPPYGSPFGSSGSNSPF